MSVTRISQPLHRRTEVESAQNASSAFFNLAGQFFSKLPADLDSAAKYSSAHKAELIAASTNLALSIELSLKALAMATGSKVLKSHNLLDLFNALTAKIQTSVELMYDEGAKQLPSNAAAATIIYITTKPIPPTEKQSAAALSKYPKGKDIRSVLRAEKDAFVNWRYFYEAGGDQDVFCYKVEHMRMCVIKNALQLHFS